MLWVPSSLSFHEDTPDAACITLHRLRCLRPVQRRMCAGRRKGQSVSRREPDEEAAVDLAGSGAWRVSWRV